MKRNLVLTILLVAAIGAAGEGEPDPARVALLAIADARRFDAGLVTTLAAAADPRTRGETARVLGRLDCLEALDTLEVLSRDRDPEVRAKAVEAVGRLALRWPGSLPVVQARRAGVVLVRAMADPSPEVRGAACWAAPMVPFPKRGQRLARRAGSDPSLEVRRQALEQLWRLPDTRWVTTAVKAAQHVDVRVRLAATWSLARGGDARADPVLVERATDKDPAVRVVAFDAVRRGHAAALWEPVSAATAAADGMVRTAAWAALAAALEKEPGRTLSPEVVGRLAGVIEQRDPERAHERVAAIRLAGAANVCLPQLEVVAGGEKDWIAAEAAAALGRRPERLEATVRIATSDSDPRQLTVVRALGRVAGGTATLEALLAHPEARVRLAAVEAATDSGGQELEVALAERLEDPDPVVRASVIGALAKAGRLPPTAVLLERLAREREKGDTDCALALIEVLAAPETLPDAVRDALRLTVGAGDATVARAAWAALVAHGESLAAPTLAPTEDDEYYRGVATWARKPRFLEMVTERGTIQIELNSGEAPLETYRLWRLAEEKFYEKLTIHRVVPTFVVQGGDPRGDGWGGPGFVLRHEDSLTPYLPGVVGLAHAGPDTAGCQLFVTLTRQPHLDGRYPVVGRVVNGLEVAHRLRVGDRILRLTPAAELGRYDPIWYGALDPTRLETEITGWHSERVEYQPSQQWLDVLASAKLRYELIVALGTWCGDSREQVPRLQAILAALGDRSPFVELRLVGVDRSKWIDRTLYRFGQVEAVPTIVVTAGGGEIGRIVETPASGKIEKDLARILAPVEGWKLSEAPHD